MANDAQGAPEPVAVTTVAGRTVLTPPTSITVETCDSLEAAFDEIDKTPGAEIILDAKSVAFLDSKALELLLKMHRVLREGGGGVKIIGLNDVCQDILVATRLQNVLLIYSDINAAIRSRAGR